MDDFNRPVIEAGEIIVCPVCDEELLKVVKPLFQDEPLRYEHFLGLTVEYPNGSKFICHKCKNPFFTDDGYFFIKGKGWMPKQIVPGPRVIQ